MKIVQHRINQKESLKTIAPEFGVEIDIRTKGEKLILQHDPFIEGELFEEWLNEWNGQFLILNVKEDALEQKILELLKKFSVFDYFFLDQSFPSLLNLVGLGNRNVAARVSEIENVQTAVNSGAKWAWLDCFSGNWDYLIESVPKLTSVGIKTCLVSPELQRVDSELELMNLQELLRSNCLEIDAVCTKKVEMWY